MKKKLSLKDFKAVLFDMDGVLVDSMPYHYIAWFEAFKDFDVRVSPDIIFKMEGAKWHDVAGYVFKKSKKKLTTRIENAVFSRKEKYFKKHFQRYIFTEALDIIMTVKKRGFLAGLVTGSNLSEAQDMLPKKIYDLFDARVSGDMVKRGKPFPDPYLLAAEKLKIKPSQCFVVENAPYGIKSAKSAKMYCAAISTSLSKEFLSQADIVFNNHNELHAYLKKILNGKVKG